MSFFKSKPKPPTHEPFFPWFQADYSVGIARFDQDHKLLANLIDQIHFALTHNQGRAEASQLMDQLVRETRLHFFREEKALKEAAYPELEIHMAEHQLLIREAEDLLRQFHSGSISGMAFPAFLKSWLIGHIKESDRKYSACLRRTGER